MSLGLRERVYTLQVKMKFKSGFFCLLALLIDELGLGDEIGNTYIHTYFIGSSPRGFSESILHYKIINQVHDNKNITMIKEDKGQ